MAPNQPDPFAAALAVMLFPDEQPEAARMRKAELEQWTARACGELKKRGESPFHTVLSLFEDASAFPNNRPASSSADPTASNWPLFRMRISDLSAL